MKKRSLALLLILTMIFSLIPPGIEVHAAAVTDIAFESLRIDTQNGPVMSQRLILFGLDFNNPQVFGGEYGSRPLSVNTLASTKNVLIIDDKNSLNEVVGKSNQIKVYNNNGADLLTVTPINFDLSGIAHVREVSNRHVYVGEPLDISGLGFTNIDPAKDRLYISGTQYTLSKGPFDPNTNTAYVINDSKISIGKVMSPNFTGVSDVKIIRYARDNAAGRDYEITSTYRESIKVVGKITDVEIERIDPNVGPRNKENIISIYGKSDINKSNFTSSMRIFAGGKEGKNLGTIKDPFGKVIGLSVQLPTSDISGAVDLTITNSDLSSEVYLKGGFVYLDIGNTLSIDANGITPNYKKETEDAVIELKGRNIGYFVGAGYDWLTVDPYKPEFNKGYDYLGYGRNTYVVEYTGKYKDSTNVVIRKQIEVYIDGYAHIIEYIDNEGVDHTKDALTVSKEKDTIKIKVVDVNLPEPKQPKKVDVVIKTRTRVIDTVTNASVYDRTEEYIVDGGFTFLPDEVFPTLSSITPNFGPNDKDVYVTIRGRDFQVIKDGLADAKYPVVTIGGRTYTYDKNNPKNFMVFDDKNKEVDGKIIQVGTKIKFIMKPPIPNDNLLGAVDVYVRNPSGGQNVLINGFIFKRPMTTKMPIIYQVKESHADIRGGIASGERITITGENFDTSSETSNARVTVTIDGELAGIVGKVSSDGKTITVIPPPGTLPGMTQLQVINSDGSMASAPFEYRLVTSAPKILKITPIKGGKGTKLIIKGEDFILPDRSVLPNEPKRRGSVVLLNGKALNAYNYDIDGDIVTKPPTNINDPDRPSDYIYHYTPGQLNGEMVKVQDISTIYVDLPDKFYSFDRNAPNYLKMESIPIGDLTVEVINPDGAKSKETVKFKYMNPQTKPTITSIDPSSGSVNGGTLVTIRGTDFKPDAIEVYFGSEQSPKVSYINSTELRAMVPPYPYLLPIGADQITVPLSVVNYDGGTAVYYDVRDPQNQKGFIYRRPGSSPVIDSVQNEEGLPKASTAGGDLLVLRGRDFRRNPDVAGDKPRVYFNGVAVDPADITWYSSEILAVKAPVSKTEGAVDIVLVNYDSGSCTYKGFMYEKSKPTITSITPSVVSKTGKVNVQINGKGFRKGNLSQLLAGEGSYNIETIVAFGDETTGDKKTMDTVIGLPFTVLGNLRVEYAKTNDASEYLISLYKQSNNMLLGSRVIRVDNAHLFMLSGSTDMGDALLGDEGVLVEVTPNKIIVTRRIAPYAVVENDGLQVSVKSPPISSIGMRKLYVINNDGGKADGAIEVKNPSSNPVITYISPRNKVKKTDGSIVDYADEGTKTDSDHVEYYVYTPLNGGAFVTINGMDFRKNVKVYLNDKPLEVFSRSLNDDQLVVRVPKGAESDLDKLYRIVVINEDGGAADSANPPEQGGIKPNYIVYKIPQSAPLIEYVTPDKTSSQGGNTVTIVGDDFREKAKVFIDGIESTDVFWDPKVGYRQLKVVVPKGLKPGKKTVQVLNTDYGFGEKKDALTIISSPRIDEVFTDKGAKLDPVILSIEGGQTITLTGIEFMEGASVVVGGTLKDKSDLQSGENGLPCYSVTDTEMVVVGGTTATNVKVQSENTLTFVTPKLKQGSGYQIVIVNKDGGVSNVINVEYQKPYPDVPGQPYIEIVDGDTIKVEWGRMENISYYEVYITSSPVYKASAADYKYLTSVVPSEVYGTDRLRHYIDGLKLSTWYSIKLKAVNLFGASQQYSLPSEFKQTLAQKKLSYYVKPGEVVAGLPQNDKITVSGTTAVYTVGEKSIGNYGKGLTVDFGQQAYSKAALKTVDINFNLLKKYPNNDIRLYDKEIKLFMTATNLTVDQMKNVPTSKYKDAKMRLTLTKALGAKGDEIRLKVPTGYKVIMSPFKINIDMQVEKTTTAIPYFKNPVRLNMTYAAANDKIYSGGIYIAYYDQTTKKIQIISTVYGKGSSEAKVLRSGEYILLGKLRK